MGLPLDVEDVTAEWLSDALDAPVTEATILDAHSGTTGRVRVGVTYAEDARARPSTVFVKLAPFDDLQRRFVDAVGLGVAEARFYRDVAAAVPVRVPQVWHAAVDGDRYVMVLEDLRAGGARFPRPDDDDLGTFMERLMVELARLHAQFWAAPALDHELAFVGDGARLGFGAGGGFIGRAVDRFAGEMPPVFSALGERYVADAPAIAELYEVGPRTLAHGDPHLGNLFADDGRPGFFDWAMVMPRAGMWDVAYVLCGSVPTELRRAHEHEWITGYRDALGAEGVELAEADAWDQYRLFSVYAWTSATSTAGVGERFQRRSVALGGMRRATTAVEDLDALGYLDGALSA